MYRTDFWTLWEKARVGCVERTASKHIYYLWWNRSPAQAGCMRQVLGPGALGRPRGIGWGGRLKRGSGWGIHVNLWLIHINVWQKPLQYCKVISLQLIKINEKKERYKAYLIDVFYFFFVSILFTLALKFTMFFLLLTLGFICSFSNYKHEAQDFLKLMTNDGVLVHFYLYCIHTKCQLQNYYDRIILYQLYYLLFQRRIWTNTFNEKQFAFFKINDKRKRSLLQFHLQLIKIYTIILYFIW